LQTRTRDQAHAHATCFFRGDRRNSPRPIALTRQKFRWHNKRQETRGKTNSHRPSGLLKQITQKERNTSTWKSNRQVTSKYLTRRAEAQAISYSSPNLNFFRLPAPKVLIKPPPESRTIGRLHTPSGPWTQVSSLPCIFRFVAVQFLCSSRSVHERSYHF